MTTLDERLADIATVPILLVASDYDGTLAPIVPDPTAARPDREAIVALRMLASLPQTHVAIISGRALSDLAALTGFPDEVRLVGSHGSEFDPGFATALSPGARALRERIHRDLREIAANGDGFFIEEKPASIAFHFRNAPQSHAEEALRLIESGPGAVEGVFTKQGKKVVELCVVATDKGRALETIRHRCAASAALFFGDDRTDEDAFATLTGPDLAVKVGEGESVAPFRLEGPREVTRVLARRAGLRARWLEGAAAVPIEEHSVLSDQRTIALVTPEARVSWMCLPRIDSSALFAELVGGATAGYFGVRSADGAAPTGQEYVEDSMSVRTRWKDFTVTDLLDCADGRRTHRAGRTDLLRVIEGRGRVIIEFAPRLDFGRVPTRLLPREGGLEVEGTLDPIVLRAPGIEWSLHEEGPHQTARAEILLGETPLVLELRHGTANLGPARVPASDRIRRTHESWASWADALVLPGLQRDLVRRSALTLKALCYGPTGAVAAAGTTSLPEHVGGIRNWDYRYCWLRDAAMAASSLVRLGSTTEAMQLLDWTLGVIDASSSPERLRPLYTVTGTDLTPEADVTELSGYRASRPVRVGNAASRQVQLDVFGNVVDLVARLADHDAPLSSEHWRLVEAMVHAVAVRWHEPDHGIWEIRGPRRHHVHSRVMCWVTVDRAIRIARHLLDRRVPEWETLRDRIASDVVEHGYHADTGIFAAAYDGVDLDAATLSIGLSGLLPPDDARFVRTVEAVDRELRSGPTVYRYRYDDGLPGFEGGFHLCTAWLIESFDRIGRHDEARRLFDDLCTLAGPTGMLSEQYDPQSKRALGNVPQAYSHIAIIDSALHLSGM
jgi:trehalose 6-phosphate phosphatase